MAEEKKVEIARSFSYKMSLPGYENRDFFCSQKAECLESEAEEVSEALHEFVKAEVIKSVNKYIAEGVSQSIPLIEKPKKEPYMPKSQADEEAGEEEVYNQKLAAEKEREEALPEEELPIINEE